MVPEAFMQIGLQMGWIVFWAFLGVLVLITALGFIGGMMQSDAGMATFVVGGAVTLLVGLGGAVAAIPFNPAYYHMYSVSGHVDRVSNVGVMEDDGALSRVPVINLDTVDVPLIMEDPRAVGLQGKNVELRCDITWKYEAADQYYCKIREIG